MITGANIWNFLNIVFNTSDSAFLMMVQRNRDKSLNQQTKFLRINVGLIIFYNLVFFEAPDALHQGRRRYVQFPGQCGFFLYAR